MGVADILFGQQSHSRKSLFHTRVVGQAAAEVARKIEASPGLAAAYRFVVPPMCARDPPTNCGRQTGLSRPIEREARRNQSADHRARRQNSDGQRLSFAWTF